MYHLSTYKFDDPVDIRLLDYMKSTECDENIYRSHMGVFLSYKGFLSRDDTDFALDTSLIADSAEIEIVEEMDRKTAFLNVKEELFGDRIWDRQHGEYTSFAVYELREKAKDNYVGSQLKYDQLDMLGVTREIIGIHREVIAETGNLPSKSFWDKTMAFLRS